MIMVGQEYEYLTYRKEEKGGINKTDGERGKAYDKV